MDNQGRGITYNNGKIVFVNNALSDEDVELEIILDKKKYSIANVKKYNKICNKRIKAKCKYYDICGGCQLQHISYDEQIKYKENYLKVLILNLKKLNNLSNSIIEIKLLYNQKKNLAFIKKTVIVLFILINVQLHLKI